ncbi:MAG: glycoside hydrolase family 3 N-terminal domain-containing protein, partial [bacterium]
MRRVLFFLHVVNILTLFFTIFVSAFAQDTKAKFPYFNPKLPVEERVQDLVNRMSIEEKITQLQCEIQAVDGRDSIITKGLGNLAISLRPLGPREAAEKANRIQKLAIEKTRLGIPSIIHDEALHGLVGKEATSFPQAIGLAATWNPALMEKIASVIGEQ